MVEVVKQIIKFYLENNRAPSIWELVVLDKSLVERKANLFVTLYKSWEVTGSAWNIKELEQTALQELISNTIAALNDERFPNLTLWEVDKIQIRVDEINTRQVLSDWEILKLDPIKSWIIAIKKDREKLAVILPNISPLLINGSDFEAVLDKKLWEKSEEKNYDLFAITTKQETSF
jgi:AMMECR1 domain-containing protein